MIDSEINRAEMNAIVVSPGDQKKNCTPNDLFRSVVFDGCQKKIDNTKLLYNL